VVAVVVDQSNFIAKSRASLEALKSANLLKSINLDALIVGEAGTGKTTLAKFIMPSADIVDGEVLSEALSSIELRDSVIIKNFDKILNYQKLKIAIKESKTRIIATSNTELLDKVSNDFFSLKITIPPLSERHEDIEPLVEKFFKEISAIFIENYSTSNISLKDLNINLSSNAHSLKKSVYIKYLVSSFEKEDVMQVVEEFLSKNIGGRNDYREQLHIFDVPMIRCGFKKFSSQLNMSEKFGINRNTLRKKINKYKKDYKLQ